MSSAFQSGAAFANKSQTPTPWNAYPQLAAAGLWTTPSDIAGLLIEVCNALAGNGLVLTQASAQAMLSPVDGYQYGLGGAVRNIDGGSSLLFMKSGANRGFTNWLAFYPQLGEGLVVFTNYVPQPSVFTSIFQAAATAMNWPDFPGLEDSGPPVGG